MAKIAYLFGVSQYESWLEPLPAAVKDVDAMEVVLRDRNIGEFDRVEAFRDLSADRMRSEMETLLTNCGQDDLVLLYFSGHGMTDPMGRFYFMARDTEANQQTRFGKAKAIDSQFVHDLMENCNSQRLVVILDCCHSGAFVQRGVGEIDFEQQLGGKGRIVLTASAATKYSFEQEGEELAIYTRYLVKGLKTGAADRDGKGFVTVDDLHDYVKEQLQTAASGMSPQRYVVKGDGEKIRLANAAVSDPEREYRKLVKEKCVRTGSILPAGRRILDQERNRLMPFGLTIERAEAIESEELEPHLKRRENQKIYRETLEEILELDRDQRVHGFEEVSELEDRLKLAIEDLKAIRQDVLGSETLPQMPTVVQPATPKSKPTPSKLADFCENLGGGIFGGDISLDMVAIPAGSFLMGAAKGEQGASDDEHPQHKVTIAPFWMGKFTVTQAQWKAIAKLKKIKCDLKPDPSNFKGADRPVEQVSWDEAIEFCDRLSAKTRKRYGLPSEAQWEYACRAGTTTPFHFGETISTDLANYRGTDWEYNGTTYLGFYGKGSRGEYRQETTNVGKFPSNAFGLYDMHGNVWEWCGDPWHDSYKDAPIDGSVWQKNGNEKARMLRGGAWFNNPSYCRSSDRYWVNRVNRSGDFGFRILLSFSPQDS